MNNQRIIFLYGPSGTGKTSTGRVLADQLELPFIDLDEAIAVRAGKSIPEIFETEGEAYFRQLENAELQDAAGLPAAVIALGGGALLSQDNRRLAQANGPVVCLSANLDVLVSRLSGDQNRRPLLTGTSKSQVGEPDAIRPRLHELLERRADHYASFPFNLDVSDRTPGQAAWDIQVRLGWFRIRGMGQPYPVRAFAGSLASAGELLLANGLHSPSVMVADTNLARLHAQPVLASLQAAGVSTGLAILPAGEQYKTLAAIQDLWRSFLHEGLDRSSTVLALGGGVTGDLAGFAAATFLRGLRWVGLPTSLLAMVDASLGGKTGADLPEGKNLIGAFHPPALVLADPQVLSTLPEEELRSGMAEVVKHGMINDPHLFALCSAGWEQVRPNLVEIVRRAMAVKIEIIQQDPFEKNRRAALNLGHTLGHALELASDYRLRHGEAVAIGMVAAARFAEKINLAERGLAEQLTHTLEGLGLPVEIPAGLDRARILAGIGVDKKRKGGKVRLALPVRVGEVVVGVPLEHPEHLLG